MPDRIGAWLLLLSLLLLLGFAVPGLAQSPPASPPREKWISRHVGISGLLDGYYSYNANHPNQNANGQQNDLYNFNDKADQLSLSMAELNLKLRTEPVAAEVDLIFGRANSLIHSPSNPQTLNYVRQAFLTVKPFGANSVELDFGQFVTSAGAEVIEAKDDWNYSRSLLFSWAIPYYHFGLRTNAPLTKSWTTGLQIVNGWNSVAASNGGVTWGLTSAYARPKYTWSFNYYTGPEIVNARKGYRNLIDSTLLLTPAASFSAYINYDYGQIRSPASPTVPEQSPHWQGVAFAARERLPGKSAIAARYEYFDDNQGFATGTAQTLEETTVTYEYKWRKGLISRAEYRRDWSDADFFHKGGTEMVKAQSTATAALIAFFGSTQ